MGISRQKVIRWGRKPRRATSVGARFRGSPERAGPDDLKQRIAILRDSDQQGVVEDRRANVLAVNGPSHASRATRIWPPIPETDLAKEWRQRNEDKKSPCPDSFAAILLPKISRPHPRAPAGAEGHTPVALTESSRLGATVGRPDFLAALFPLPLLPLFFALIFLPPCCFFSAWVTAAADSWGR